LMLGHDESSCSIFFQITHACSSHGTQH
jgi:hypothetical protein